MNLVVGEQIITGKKKKVRSLIPVTAAQQDNEMLQNVYENVICK